jgi:predicted lipid-binding transport protein (Tim44 family)
MKKLLLSLFVAVLGVGFVIDDADARRLGGGRSSGMQRQMPANQAPQSLPPQQQPQQAPVVAPGRTGAAAATAAAAPRRSWLGPIAGLAAGLGLAALMSHLGLGEQFANFLMLALLAVVAIVAVRFLLRRFAGSRNPALAPRGMQYAGAGTAPGALPGRSAAALPAAAGAGAFGAGGAGAAAAGSGGVAALPADFDKAGFERIAKMIFIRMQAANDAGDLDDLRQFATPEMFAVLRMDIEDRKGAPQKTDVPQVDAEVLDVAEEGGRQIVSVRFHGMIREEPGLPAVPFDEVWHLAKPIDGSREWAIAGIAQNG